MLEYLYFTLEIKKILEPDSIIIKNEFKNVHPFIFRKILQKTLPVTYHICEIYILFVVSFYHISRGRYLPL